jgi:hypothetical protein
MLIIAHKPQNALQEARSYLQLPIGIIINPKPKAIRDYQYIDMFEAAFKNINHPLWKDVGRSSERYQ